MATTSSLVDELVSNVLHQRDSVPVFRIRERGRAEIEAEADEFARRFIALYEGVEPRIHLDRQHDRAVLALPDGGRGSVYPASGAMTVMVRQPSGV